MRGHRYDTSAIGSLRQLGPPRPVKEDAHTMNDQAALAALLRTDLRYFIRKVFGTVLPGTTYHPNWHIDAIVHELMRIHSGENRRLLISQPPRSLKSICVSIAYVVWLLGRDPTKRIIVVSYSNDFASELHRQFRMVIDASWYQALFPACARQRTAARSW